MVLFKDLNNNSFLELLFHLNNLKMNYRQSLNLPSNVTFGNEIEVNDIIFDDALKLVEDFNVQHKLRGADNFIVHQDLTCDSEFVTPIMKDTPKYWNLLWKMYLFLDENGASYGDNTSSHIHMGTRIIDTPHKLSLLLKTLVVFEPIIFKFGYGRDDNPRDFITYRPNTANYSMIMSPRRVNSFVNYLDRTKNLDPDDLSCEFQLFMSPSLRIRNCFNFNRFDLFKFFHPEYLTINPEDHMEFRNFNSADPIVVQNNIDLCGHLFSSVANGTIDEDYINEEYKKYKKKRYNFDEFCSVLDSRDTGPQYNRILDGYRNVKMDKAIKLADMIFDDEISKYYFLKQYLKLFKKDEEYVKSLVK